MIDAPICELLRLGRADRCPDECRGRPSHNGAVRRRQDSRHDNLRLARAIYLRARALNETLKPHEAHELFQQAVTLDQNFAMGEFYLASTAPSAKEQSAHLNRALALADRASPGERLMILGMQARASADRERARQLAESLVVLYPNDERARFVPAAAYTAQQRYGDEIAQFEKAIALNPSYSLAYNQLGYAYRAVGNMSGAESAFQRYIALIPSDPNPHDSYAELLMKMGRFDASIAEYEKALAIDPHFGASYVGIAANDLLAQRHDAAVAQLEKYYKLARNDNERRAALVNEAMVAVDRGDAAGALAAMERSRDIAADFKQDDLLDAYYDAARVALVAHQRSTARTEAAAYASGAAARKNDARLRQSHELNARVALDAKEFDVALAELAAANQENPAVWYAMSRAYAGKGDVAKASKLASQARQLNILPTFPYVFTRASIAGATAAASSRTARETPY